MKIKELIKKLKTFDGDIEVLLPSEGLSSKRLIDNGGIRLKDVYYIGSNQYIDSMSHLDYLDRLKLEKQGFTKCLLLTY